MIDQPLIKTTVDEFILSMFLLQSYKNLPVNPIILLIAQVYYIVWTTEREKNSVPMFYLLSMYILIDGQTGR